MNVAFPISPSVQPLPDPERDEVLRNPGFGRHFSDHMASAVWTADGGWGDHRVGALEPFSLHPSAAVLHYAQEIFEGLKAYRHDDGGVWLFRPRANAARFARSARRLALPVLAEDDFVTSIEQLVRADQAWVPPGRDEKSLYLRPFMFASEAFLGVRPATTVTYSVIASPAGAYFAAGVTGVTLWVSTDFTRAAAGGTGAAKCGGNYAGGLAAQLQAQEHGCDQVMYLDGSDRGLLEESGTMNLCIVTADAQLITPELGGTILEGITRDSVLQLAGKHGLSVTERPIGLAELRSGCESGAITEVFATGTAAVITPVVGFKGEGYEFGVGAGPGKHTLSLRDHVLDIQYGRAEDPHGWMHRVI